MKRLFSFFGKHSRLALFAACLVILVWQSSFFFRDPSHLSRQALGGTHGLHFAEYQRFFGFYERFGTFPVAARSGPVNWMASNEEILQAHGHELINDLDYAIRTGELGKLFLFLPDYWIRHDLQNPRVSTGNGILLIAGFLVLLVSFAIQGELLFAFLLVLMLGSYPFLTWESYIRQNVFALPLIAFIWIAALNASLIFRRRHLVKLEAWPFAATLLSGLLLACFREVRPEPSLLLAGLLVFYVLRTRGWKARSALILGVLAGYQATHLYWQQHWDGELARATSFVAAQGGNPLPKEAQAQRYHELWHPIFCGLGDFGQDKGYQWDDLVAMDYAWPRIEQRLGHSIAPRKGYYLAESWDAQGDYPKRIGEVAVYHDIIREKVVSDIKSDPLWYLRILLKRMNRMFFAGGQPFPWILLAGLGLLACGLRWAAPSVWWLVLLQLPLSATGILIHSDFGRHLYQIGWHLLVAALLVAGLRGLDKQRSRPE